MNRRKPLINLITLLTLVPLLISLPTEIATASPGIAFNCNYDSTWEEIDYEVKGGEEGVTYTVEGSASGAIKLSEAPEDLTGPDDSADVDLECVSKGKGCVTLTFKKGNEVKSSCTHCFTCSKSGATPKFMQVSIPSFTQWGLVALGVLLACVLVWLLVQPSGIILD